MSRAAAAKLVDELPHHQVAGPIGDRPMVSFTEANT